MNKIYPFIWFEDKAEEAANYYVNLFPDSKINEVLKYPKSAEAGTGRPGGSVMTVDLQLNGMHFVFLNGGKSEGFNLPNGSVSFTIICDTQKEVDKYWNSFSDGGKPNVCGWIQDKYGVTWQVVPRILPKFLSDPNKAKSEAVMACFMQMTKFDIAELQKAYDNA
ncbi:MAG TPA: VOC family protein [Candidatus Saccharimonadales bacterium]|nr:VOC family protein [Candidatus Saccharimonadales bacterium]